MMTLGNQNGDIDLFYNSLKKSSVLFWWWYLLPHIVTIDLKSMSKRKMTKAVIVFSPLLMWSSGMWGKSIVLTKGGGMVVWYGSCMVVQKKTKAMVTNSPRLVMKPSKSWRINSSLSLRTKDFQLPHVWGWKCGRRLPDLFVPKRVLLLFWISDLCLVESLDFCWITSGYYPVGRGE